MCNDDLYRLSYDSSLRVLKNVIPYIAEDDETKARLARAVKDVPRIIASEFSCKVEDVDSRNVVNAAKMCREIQVMLSFCRDLNGQFINGKMCAELMGAYGFVENGLMETVGVGSVSMEGLGC